MKSFGKYIKETYADSGLGKWFGKGGKGGKTEGGWDRYNSKGEKVGKCGDADDGDAYAACLSAEKANKLGKDGIASFVKRKRAAQKKAGDSSKGGESKKGQKPTYVATKANEEVIDEKNEPTNPKLWAQAKAQAKKKFDVYPSAYANAWASRKYKEMGGGWRKADESVELGEQKKNCGCGQDPCITYGKQVNEKKKTKKGHHDCATHVEHARFGKGTCIHSQHAAPDENGNISWYDVMFEHGVEKQIPTTHLNILESSMHEDHEHHGNELDEDIRDLKTIVGELKKASKMHLGQSKRIKAHLDSMKEDWQKVNRQDKTDGLSQKAVDAYRRENPGSKLQTAVTEKKPTGKRAARRKSFCSRMKGMKAKLTSPETKRDPDSRINKALRRWNCN